MAQQIINMTRNELKELWFTIPHKKKETTKTIVVNVNSSEINIISDGNTYHSVTLTQVYNPLIYALNLDEYKSGEYKLVIK